MSLAGLHILVEVLKLTSHPETKSPVYCGDSSSTLFKATVSDYNADIMKNAKLGAFLGYAYFLTFMILNLILIVNLIVARLSSTYKKYN